MIIEASYVNGETEYIPNVKNYDFYPETRMLFIEDTTQKAFYIPVSEKVKSLMIEGGTERGYLEGHDEAR